jgi:hypothetical protein
MDGVSAPACLELLFITGVVIQAEIIAEISAVSQQITAAAPTCRFLSPGTFHSRQSGGSLAYQDKALYTGGQL